MAKDVGDAFLTRLISMTRAAGLALVAALGLAACATTPVETISPELASMYGEMTDGDFIVPAVPARYLNEDRKRQEVPYYAPYSVGTIVVDPEAKRLYHITGENVAMRYTVGVGRAGYGLSGEARVAHQRDWPYWTPTANMLRREPEKYGPVRAGIEGGLENPLGARAMYLYRGSRDTLYRIHGTPYPWSVGEEESGGCIRMFNQDSMYLAEQVDNGTRVVILTAAEGGKWTLPDGGVAEGAFAESLLTPEQIAARDGTPLVEEDKDEDESA